MLHETCRKRLPSARVLLAWAVVAIAGRSSAAALGAEAEFPQVVSVTKTFDHRPFEYRIQSRSQQPAFSIYQLTFPSPVVTPVPQNNVVPAEYYLPKGTRAEDPKRPAVICMHILEGDFVLERTMCSMLASHGIPAIMFKLPYYGERGLADGPHALAASPELLVGALSQGFEDVRRTIDLLASRPEVDPQRIGITGISLGGIVAATAAGRDPRLHRAMLILAGGDLMRIIHHARETRDLSELIMKLPPDGQAEIERAVDAVDPLRYAPSLRDRAQRGQVLMVNAGEDEVIPRPCTDKLASALGVTDQVVWLEGLGHYTAMAELPRVLETAVEFFGQDMPAGLEVARRATGETPVPRAESRTPLEVVASLLQQIREILTSEPEGGRCHFVDLELAVTPEGHETIQGRLLLIRGARWRFKLECRAAMLGEAALGQGDYPWMVSAGKVLFRGVRDAPGEPLDPLTFARSENLVKLRVLGGAAGGLAIAPQVLNQWVTIVDATPAGGPPTIRISRKRGHSTFWPQGEGSVDGSGPKAEGPLFQNQDHLELTLRGDGKTPDQITFQVAGVRGTVALRGWQANTVAHPSMFQPPSGLVEKDVNAVDLYRTFSAMFNYAMENTR